jgi:hypothetical protein
MTRTWSGSSSTVANDQLKTHLRGPGRLLRSRLPDLVCQEIWAYLIRCAISVLIARAADLDPDRISYTRALRIIRAPPLGRRLPALSATLTSCRTSWPRSPRRSTSAGGTAPVRAPSKSPPQQLLREETLARPPAPATTSQPPSISTTPLPAQHDQISLRALGLSPVGRTATMVLSQIFGVPTFRACFQAIR